MTIVGLFSMQSDCPRRGRHEQKNTFEISCKEIVYRAREACLKPRYIFNIFLMNFSSYFFLVIQCELLSRGSSQAKWGDGEEEVELEWEHFRESQTGFVSVLIVWVGSIWSYFKHFILHYTGSRVAFVSLDFFSAHAKAFFRDTNTFSFAALSSREKQIFFSCCTINLWSLLAELHHLKNIKLVLLWCHFWDSKNAPTQFKSNSSIDGRHKKQPNNLTRNTRRNLELCFTHDMRYETMSWTKFICDLSTKYCRHIALFDNNNFIQYNSLSNSSRISGWALPKIVALSSDNDERNIMWTYTRRVRIVTDEKIA